MKHPSEYEVHAYVDGRLDPEQREQIEAWLRHHPAQAEQVRAWQRDAQWLRATLGGAPAAPVPAGLDPAHLRRTRRRRRRLHVSVAASVILSLFLGGALGWQMRGASQIPGAPPMADAVQAYRMFAQAAPQTVSDEIRRDPRTLQTWLTRHFGQGVYLPRLGGAGFQPVDGRLMATAYGPAALVIYRNAQGDAISFYVRPSSPRGRLPRGEHREGNLLAQYWSGGGYNYAMVSRTNVHDVAVARQALPQA